MSAEDVQILRQAGKERIAQILRSGPLIPETEVEQAAALARLQARVTWLEDKLNMTTESWYTMTGRAEAAEAREAALREALERVAQQQPKTLAMIEQNGFIFDSIGRGPGNWQHLAFSIYNDLCEVETWASAALAADPESEEAPE